MLPRRVETLVSVSKTTTADNNMTLEQVRQNAERTHIANVLADNDWHMQNTAAILGISHGTLWERMQKLGLQKK
ncbi:MAG: helix-turn-helix domain-containing protein [Pseudomonadota bacterium]